MSLDSTEWHVDYHRPDISNTQEYTDEQGRSDDKTKEKNTREVENQPNSAIDAYDVIEIFEDFFLFRQDWSNYLSHNCIVSYFALRVKYLILLSCSVIENPYIITLSDADFTEIWLKHVFSVMNTRDELIEYLCNSCLSRTEVFTTYSIDVATISEALFESASTQLVSDIASLAEGESVVLSYRIEGG